MLLRWCRLCHSQPAVQAAGAQCRRCSVRPGAFSGAALGWRGQLSGQLCDRWVVLSLLQHRCTGGLHICTYPTPGTREGPAPAHSLHAPCPPARTRCTPLARTLWYYGCANCRCAAIATAQWSCGDSAAAAAAAATPRPSPRQLVSLLQGNYQMRHKGSLPDEWASVRRARLPCVALGAGGKMGAGAAAAVAAAPACALSSGCCLPALWWVLPTWPPPGTCRRRRSQTPCPAARWPGSP